MIVSTQDGLRESRRERLRRLRPVIEQLAVAAAQLELSADEVIGALRERMETKHE